MKQEPGRRGLGRIYLRGRTWWIQFSFRGTTYRESSESEKESDATKLLKKRLGEMGRGRLIGPKVERTTFSALEKLISDDYAINERASIPRLNTALDHLRGAFGFHHAIDITGFRLSAYANDRLSAVPPASPASVRIELAALRRAFVLAKKSEMVADIPSFPTITVENARKGFFEDGDFRAVAEKLADHLRPLAVFGFLTGWRVSEIRGLTWRNVDLDGGWVRLEPGETKNGEGRAFPLRAFPELDALMKQQREAVSALERDLEQIVPWVFPKPSGKRIGDFRKRWNAACKSAGVAGLLFHDLRRTTVRNLERAGVSRSASMKLTGHKTESVFRRYAIVAESDLQEAVGKLSRHHEAVAVAVAAKRKVVPFSEGRGREQAQNDHNPAPQAEAGSASA